jgi:mono/diheme cytochrome c family protein
MKTENHRPALGLAGPRNFAVATLARAWETPHIHRLATVATACRHCATISFQSGIVRLPAAVIALSLLCSVSPSAVAQQPAADSSIDQGAEARHFALYVLPLLKDKCLGCHGGDADDIKGEYDVRTRQSTIKGGESEEPAIVVGNPQDSPLLHAVTWEGLEMPPKENDRLTEEQIEWIRRWIEVGAPWPGEQKQAEIMEAERTVEENEEGVLISTSGGLADTWTYRRYLKEDVWAFRPVAQSFAYDNIDAFINARLDDAGVAPAIQATPEQLIRRVTFDLTGLPPTPREIDYFSASWKQDAEQAWSDLVDRLLASEHYGERWAQHWLDVARYADTGGFSNDYERSNAWRYRDYVIRSFNADKPYNQFVIEQIAGDELDPQNPEAIVATSFLRMGPWDTAMIPQEEARKIYRDDVVHSVGQTFLSTPMRCCKCHDHKFDPIPTRDYYRMYATFSATQPAEMPADFLPKENQNRFDQGKQMVETLHGFADDKRIALVDKREAAAKNWYAEHDLPYKDNNARKNDPEDKKPPRHTGLDEMEKGRLKVREQDCWIWNRRRERFQPLVQSVFNGPDLSQNARNLKQPKKIDDNWLPESFIHVGGDYQAEGDPVAPGVLSGCSLPVEGSPTDDPYALTTDVNGRRLGLAKWIADPNNPLTARSFVNRIWQHHFGHGIVRTPNNFGAKGSKPTHPQLLDWLAHQFVSGGWKAKPLHRTILMSHAYKRSTAHPKLENLAAVDPDNKLLARNLPRRLTAEELRDAMLLSSGELNRELGGLPIMPEINLEVALQPRMIQFSIAPAYQPSRNPEERNRRSIYAYRVRGQADPFMEVMNLPNPNESCELRDTAAVSPQAFTLLNSDIISDRSIALALRIEKEAEKLAGRIGRAFRLTLGRKPTGEERRAMRQYVTKMVGYHETHAPQPTSYPTEVTRSLVEEFSGDTFTFEEILPVFEDYVPDAKPATVSAETRALADMCRLLLNTNEFIYVY